MPDPKPEYANLFTGRSGHLAVMAEFLHRGINVAVPEVDVGDDVFVVRGTDEAVIRVQVKTANAEEQQGGYVGQFSVPWGQLNVPNDSPPLVYVFVVRRGRRWSDFLVIRRGALRQLHEERGVGSITKDRNGDPAGLTLRLVFAADDVQNKGASLQRFRDAFDPWPPPPHPVASPPVV
jgi:hypothetical protein